MRKTRFTALFFVLLMLLSTLCACSNTQKNIQIQPINPSSDNNSLEKTSEKEKNLEDISFLVSLIGKADEDLVKEMTKEGENIITDTNGKILSRDYKIILFDYNVTLTCALEKGIVSSYYIYLGGEDYSKWCKKLESVLGKPIDSENDAENDNYFSVYTLDNGIITLTSCFGTHYITIEKKVDSKS